MSTSAAIAEALDERVRPINGKSTIVLADATWQDVVRIAHDWTNQGGQELATAVDMGYAPMSNDLFGGGDRLAKTVDDRPTDRYVRHSFGVWYLHAEDETLLLEWTSGSSGAVLTATRDWDSPLGWTLKYVGPDPSLVRGRESAYIKSVHQYGSNVELVCAGTQAAIDLFV